MAAEDDVFVMFEPANHMGRVVCAAKRAGTHVVALHYYPFTTLPPYSDDFAQIDEHVQVDGFDDHAARIQDVERLSRGKRIVGTYAGQEYTLELESKVRARAGLPHNPPELVGAVLDKLAVRKRLTEAGLSKVRFWGREEVERWTEWPAGLVAFFKPVNGGGSCLVKRCTSLDDLRRCQDAWHQKEAIAAYPPFKAYVERSDAYMVEEEVPGRLCSLEGFVYDGQYHPIGATGRRVLRRDPAVEMGAVFPEELPDWTAAVEHVRRVHELLGLRHGPTHTEFMLLPDGGIELIELNARFVGADVLICMNVAFDAQVEDHLFALSCGRNVERSVFEQPRRFAQLQYLLPPLHLDRFESIEFGEGTLFQRTMKKPGDEIRSKLNQVDWIAGLVVAGQTRAESEIALRQAVEAVRINGSPIASDENNVTV
jgi:biotin carboxylase